ncbi:ribosome biogenesis GTP-binding protein YihA/YsxC [Bosea lathyri]|nr:ribosome biogenesis GTP-binding protein YihA/YsxC [Bosea lathyri]
MTKPFTEDEIESARKLFEGAWDFVWASTHVDDLPPMVGQEIAFAGRSNVGKSSLINGITRRNALARTSHTPGRTQQLNFFRKTGEEDSLTIVDMPGYGYAAVGRAKVASWTNLIHEYLRGRSNLMRVYVLIDARHGIKDVDGAVLQTLDKAAVSYQVVLTKADAIKKSDQQFMLEATYDEIKRRPAAFPEVLLTSSETGLGIPELRAAVGRVLAERQ